MLWYGEEDNKSHFKFQLCALSGKIGNTQKSELLSFLKETNFPKRLADKSQPLKNDPLAEAA